MPRQRAIREWEESQRELAEVEISLVRARLNGVAPSAELLGRAAALRDRTNHLFEVAQAFLAPPFVASDPGVD